MSSGGVLHSSEYIQCATLYSVTSLIFCMGITKGISIRKFFATENKIPVISYTIKAMKPVLLSYVIVTSITDIFINGVTDWFQVFEHLLRFNAAGPFYFILLYIKLSLWAPLIYTPFYYIELNTKKGTRCLLVILLLLFIWNLGYFSINVCDIFGQSYLFVYSLGIIVSFMNIQKISLKSFSISVGLLIIGIFFTYKFYFARVAGNYAYAELIDIIDPKLQMNPPNISIILYSFGVIGIVYHIANFCKNSLLLKSVGFLGKYSLDIFLWHMFIREILSRTVLVYLDHIWIRRIVYYAAMFGLPILGRMLYIKIKQIMYKIGEHT